MKVDDEYGRRRMIFAVVKLAVADLKSGNTAMRASAEWFLRTHGAAYLRFSGIPRPQEKIDRLLEHNITRHRRKRLTGKPAPRHRPRRTRPSAPQRAYSAASTEA